MTNRVTVKLTANFERNLADIEQFLTEAEAPQAFDGLIDELLGTVLPNLERFPELDCERMRGAMDTAFR